MHLVQEPQNKVEQNQSHSQVQRSWNETVFFLVWEWDRSFLIDGSMAGIHTEYTPGLPHSQTSHNMSLASFPGPFEKSDSDISNRTNGPGNEAKYVLYYKLQNLHIVGPGNKLSCLLPWEQARLAVSLTSVVLVVVSVEARYGVSPLAWVWSQLALG